ncbi:MAG: sigma-70 family RNA polymerase sigma factor [Bradymonadales bacterium]|nr:sigma-70 family RNA polymerase sigma factor [Bradymonadales bacterium]
MEWGEEEQRDLLEAHRPIILRLALDIKKRYRLAVDLEELVAAGCEGLVQAQHNFDRARGVSFTTFAYYRIRGAILDNCRRLGLMHRVYLKKARFESAANDVLQQAAEAAPSSRSASASSTWLADTMDEMAVAFRLSEQSPEHLPGHQPSPEAEAELGQLKARLSEQLQELSDEEQAVLRRYYFAGEPMGSIAEDYGVSVSWVSRVHTRALRKLRPMVLGKRQPKPCGSDRSE